MIIRKNPNALNRLLVIALTLSILISVLHINFISAQGEASYCCERLKVESGEVRTPSPIRGVGAWCQNAPVEKCHTSYRMVPTSCEATSYCRLGTCYNTNEGTCMENTPQKVCQNSGGVWHEGEPNDLPQCQLGCCLVGEQAAFVTQTRCKALAGLYSLETNYRTDIQNEVECIASARSSVKGACVIDNGFERTCKFITKKECLDMQGSSEGGGLLGIFGGGESEGETNIEFHEGYLCSADELATNCGPSEKTTCVEGKDEAFFVDTCGNLANIYDSSKINDKNYWKEIYNKAESCSLTNANRKACGNCDYYDGTTCKAAKRGDAPTHGDNICKDLGCEDNDFKSKYNRQPKHGETWCVQGLGTSEIIVGSEDETNPTEENLPGTRYFRKVCYNNEVSVEPCADFRQEVCLESEVGGTGEVSYYGGSTQSYGGFKTAACRANMWQDCTSQEDEDDCLNTDKRDCQWIKGGEKDENKKTIEVCVPKYAPGFDFWEEGTDAEDACGLASTQCIVKYEKGFFERGWELVEDDKGKCLDDGENVLRDWRESKEKLCLSLGDCGSSINYLGDKGFDEDWDDAFVEPNEDEE